MSIPSVEADRRTWAKVGELVRARRNALGLTIGDAVARAGAGIQQTTWSKLENAQQTAYSVRGLYAVCRALRWTPDSIERIIAGQDPEPIPAESSDDSQQTAFLLAVDADPILTDAEKRIFKAMYAEARRGR